MTALFRVVAAELFKARRKRRTYVLAGLWWIVLPVLALVLGQVVQTNLAGSFVDETGTTVASIVQAFASPYGLTRIALTGPAFLSPTYYMIVVALLAAVFFGEERSLNMWKTTLVAQPSRLAVLWGKIVAIQVLLGVMLAGAMACAALAGTIGTAFLPTDFTGAWGSLLGLYALQWALLTAATLFASLLIFLVRNVALGIVLTFFLPALLEGLYRVWRLTVGFEPLTRLNAPFQALRLRETFENLPRYFFTDNLLLPAKTPVGDLMRTFGESVAEGGQGDLAQLLGASLSLPHAAAVMAGYAVLFGVILSVTFVRRDVD
ncbi:MAG: ABC transporter permease [Trueperaceae bacterium]|nr:ABC transporter permease [Trueperaceae bacterium]